MNKETLISVLTLLALPEVQIELGRRGLRIDYKELVNTTLGSEVIVKIKPTKQYKVQCFAGKWRNSENFGLKGVKFDSYKDAEKAMKKLKDKYLDYRVVEV